VLFWLGNVGIVAILFGMIKSILEFYTRSFAIWVVVGGIVAYLFPGPFVALKPFNRYFFGLTMFGIGAVLQIADFQRILARPVVVLIGSCAQFTIMPLGAFILARVFKLPPAIAVGLILTGAAPGAMASNVMSYVARADTAYSVSLTTVSTLLCPILTPGLTKLLAGSILPIPFWGMFLDVMIMVILPLFAGFIVRHRFNRSIERILPVFPALSVTFIIFICSVVIALNRDRLAQVTGAVLAVAVLLNIYGMAAGYGVGKVFHMQIKRRRTLALEIGMQNAGLGTALALAHLGDAAALPAAIFVFICIITASIMAAFWQRVPQEAAT
jgi:BASS family bile acid:Na+ symporter